MSRPSPAQVAIIGAGPAGLMAAEVLASGGAAVTVYEAMPSAGRKFLMAGRGGLNLTHSEALPGFLTRYGEALNASGKTRPLEPTKVGCPSASLHSRKLSGGKASIAGPRCSFAAP